MFRTIVLIRYWGIRHQKKYSLGKKPKVMHFRMFGFLVYIYVPKEERMKVEPLGKKGTFIRYSETSKSYIIYISI